MEAYKRDTSDRSSLTVDNTEKAKCYDLSSNVFWYGSFNAA